MERHLYNIRFPAILKDISRNRLDLLAEPKTQSVRCHYKEHLKLFAVDSATAEHIAARADIEAEIRDCQIIVRTLDGIVRNIYATNIGKLAAWLAASHVEKAPKKKTPPTP